jgi:hypothetical protein
MKHYSTKQAKDCAIADMKKEHIKTSYLFNEKQLKMLLTLQIIDVIHFSKDEEYEQLSW